MTSSKDRNDQKNQQVRPRGPGRSRGNFLFALALAASVALVGVTYFRGSAADSPEIGDDRAAAAIRNDRTPAMPADATAARAPESSAADSARRASSAESAPAPSAPSALSLAGPDAEPQAPPVGTPANEPLPPLPFSLYPPPRPAQVVRAVYEFAARHPEVLQFVPCFCGCEQHGHQANDDCFVRSRDARGRVVWDDHGMG